MRSFSKYLFAFLFVPFFSHCCKPGTGGDATLSVTFMHHTRTIISYTNYRDTLFVKFNATEFPGASAGSYDTYFIGVPGQATVTCSGLKCGKYYLYGTAIDSAGPYRVTGGQAFTIKHSDRKKQQSLNLAITE